MKNVTLRQLKIFEAVARNLSFSRAAEELHLTQPAVSMQVQTLEDLAGLPLTEQAGKKVRLTAAGEEVARQARPDPSLVRYVGGIAFDPRDRAREDWPEGIAARFVLPRILVREAGGRADVLVMGTPPAEFETVAKVFAEHPLVFIAAPDHPLAGKRRIEPQRLAAETLLIREPGSGTRGALERFLEQHKVPSGATMELGSNETIKQAVMAGLGLSFISEHTIGMERAVGRLVVLDISDTPVKRQWRLVYRTDKRLMPAATAFVQFMDGEGSRLIEAQVGGKGPVAMTAAPKTARSAGRKSG